jgi:L-alanine-DL-glutamate epimerase-like enolase superfamily enzyme
MATQRFGGQPPALFFGQLKEAIVKIQSVETFATPMLSIVRVRTDDGAEGYGQLAPYHAGISTMVFHHQIAPHVLGKDALDIDALGRYCLEAEYKFPGSYICRALAGLDTALWDLRAKLEGKSVCELLGGRPCSLPVYGSSMRRDITPEAEAERLVKLQAHQGYRAFKIRVGKVCGHDEDVWPGRTEAIVPAVRKAIGAETALMVDANSGYRPQRAIEVGQLLEAYDVAHFEEPCPYWELEWTAEVAKALKVPVAGGEQDWDLKQWERIVTMRAVDIVQPDICYVGGLTRALKVAAMAEAAGLLCLPHAANLSLVTVFTLHMMGAITNAGPYLEFSIEPTPWTDNLFFPALEVTRGEVHIPDGPGWGVTINPTWLAQAEYRKSELS